MKRSTLLVAIAVVAVTAALAAQAGAVPGPVAQQETPTDGATPTPADETPAGEETPADETPTSEDTPDDEPVTPQDGGADETGATPAVTFDDQETNGTTVTVSDVTLNQSGYIVIHDQRLASGETVASVIGASDYLPAGTYDTVTITLFDVPGADFNDTAATAETPTATDETQTATGETPTATDETQTATAETPTESDNATNATDNETQRLTVSQELTAMLHVENSGNQTLDYVETAGLLDGPATINDTPVTDTANVTVVNETAADETTTGTDTPTDAGTATETETTTTDGEAGTATPATTP